MARYLSERQAWLLAAKRWGKINKNNYGGVYETTRNYGLCETIRSMWNAGQITLATYCRMKDRICEETGITIGYAWHLTAAGAKARVRFCLRMARKLERRKAKVKG